MADSGNQMSGRFSHFYTDCLSSFSALHMDTVQSTERGHFKSFNTKQNKKYVAFFCLFGYSLDSVSCDLYNKTKLY